MSKKEINNIINYNHQFYLYCLNKLEKNEVSFKITFSKSYKPFNQDIITGALKIYPTSPIVSKKQLDKIIKQIFNVKKEFDNYHEQIIDDRDTPIDFVYPEA